MLAMIMWTISHRRNQLRTSRKEFPLSQVLPSATLALSDFQWADPSSPSRSLSSTASQVRQTPPSDGAYKINFDGVTFQDIEKAGLGVVIWNSQGQAIASLSEQKFLPFSSDIVEALAAARALSFAYELGLTSFILVGDLETIIKELKADVDSFSPFGHILASAKSSIAINNCISFSHVRGLGNFITHNLTKYTRHNKGFSVQTKDILLHLFPVLFTNHSRFFFFNYIHSISYQKKY